MATVRVEIPAGAGQVRLLEVQQADAPTLADEQNLGVAYGAVPGLPGVTIIVFTATINGPEAVAHVEVPPGGTTVLLEVPAEVGLPVDDEDDLVVLPGLPGAVLALLKTA